MRYIVGVGNYSMFDDSIGIRVVEHIFENGLDKDFEAVELSSSILNLMTYFTPDTEGIVIVDSCKAITTPGEHTFFTMDEIVSKKKVINFSTHEGDVTKVISMAQELANHIPPIKFMGIGVEQIREGFGVSSSLEKNIPSYALSAIEQLKSL
ncbi:MAG: hydrogenase maturation protease [Bacteriovoracaceae bacterium]|nr:hydrogenase maturation protease [Bacteriovoracaceae bacterium]